MRKNLPRTIPPLSLSVLPIAALAALCLAPATLRAQLVSITEMDPSQLANPSQNSATTPQFTTTTQHFNGVVVSSVDGKSVARVLVTSADRRFAAFTDYQGRFSFDYRFLVPQSGTSGLGSLAGMAAPAGPGYSQPLAFQLRKPGYFYTPTVISISAAQSGATPPAIVLKIVPNGIISGRVEPDSGDLPANLRVQLMRKNIQNGAAMWFQSNNSQVSSSGEFRFADLQPGDYKLMMSAWTSPDAYRQPHPDSVPGLRPLYYPDATGPEAAGILHVGAAETVPIRLAPRAATFYRVSIPIAVPEGARFGAQLLPANAGLNLSLNNQTHTLEGYLPPGSYDARITIYPPVQPANSGSGAPSPGNLQYLMPGVQGNTRGGSRESVAAQTPSLATAHFEVGHAPVQGATLTSQPAVDIPIDITLDLANPASTDSGQNSDQNPHVFIQLNSVDNNNLGTPGAQYGAGNDNTQFTLRNVTEGVYRVMVQPTMAAYVASATSGATDLLHDPLTVGSGAADPIEITLRDDGASVSWTIQPPGAPTAQTAPDATPVYIIGIPLDRPEAAPLNSIAMPQGQLANLMPTGLFQLSNVPPGRYLFVASHQQNYQELEYRDPDVLRDLTSKGVTVTLSAGQKANVVLTPVPDEAN